MQNLTALIFFLFSFNVAAQVTVSGVISDKKGNSIPGVNIWIQDTFGGTTSNGAGEFAFETDKIDSLVLMATSIGYAPIELALNGNTTGLQITMKQQANELNAVQITAGTIEVSDKASSVVMKPLDILTTAGALGDITGALNTLPGTATVANDGRLFVRGGDASETAIFFDGLRVGNAYGTSTAGVPTRNRFSPALFKGTFFSTGGYSAEYGNALSSVLSLQTVDEPVRNQTDISFMSVGGSVSSTFVGEKQSVTAEVGMLDLTPYQEIIKQNIDWEDAPASYDGQVVYRHKLGKDGIIKGFVQASHSDMTLWQAQPGVEGRGRRIGVDNNFGFSNVSYKKPINKRWLADGGVSLSINQDRYTVDTAAYSNDHNLVHVKQKFTNYISSAFKIKAGLETIYRDYSQRDEHLNADVGFTEWRSAAFAEGEWYASALFTLRAGLRGVYTDLNDNYELEPRLAAAIQVYDKGSVSLATGTFSQAQGNDTRIWNNAIAPSKSGHLQLSFQHSDDTRTFRAEGYLKTYQDLLITTGDVTEAAGKGHANGFDIFYRDRKTLKNTDFWITYSFVDSKRQYNDFQTQVQPGFAPRHNLSVVAKYWIADWKSQVGGSWTLNSGYTYDNPNRIGEMESTSPNYASLSLNWSYLYRQNLIFHFAVNNVTGRDNIFGYSYADTPDKTGVYADLAQGQAATRFVFFGVFWTISSDKQANQLNNL